MTRALLIALLCAGCTCRVQTHAERVAEAQAENAETVARWKRRLIVVPYPELGVTCFVDEGSGYPSVSCVRDEPRGGAL